MIEKEHRTQKVGGGLKMGPGHFLGLFTQRTILGPFENAMFARPPFCPKSVCFLFFSRRPNYESVSRPRILMTVIFIL